jgi:hypothetical protein
MIREWSATTHSDDGEHILEFRHAADLEDTEVETAQNLFKARVSQKTREYFKDKGVGWKTEYKFG